MRSLTSLHELTLSESIHPRGEQTEQRPEFVTLPETANLPAVLEVPPSRGRHRPRPWIERALLLVIMREQ
jgi:hypothetical protein